MILCNCSQQSLAATNWMLSCVDEGIWLVTTNSSTVSSGSEIWALSSRATCRSPPPSENGQKHSLSQKMFWNVCKKKIPIFKNLFVSQNFNFKFLRQNFLRIWFRNANQWYPITSWLGFKLKVYGALGRSLPHTKFVFFFAPIMLVTRSKWVSEYSKRKIFHKKNFSLYFFSLF